MRCFTFPAALLSAAMIIFACGCSETDLNSIRLNINSDGSGTIVMVETSVFDNASTAVDQSIRGMDWENRGLKIACRRGSFKNVAHLDVSGIKAQVKENVFRLTVPMGQLAGWTKVLAPVEEGTDEIRKAAREEGFSLAEKPERTYKFVVRVPGKIIAQGSTPKLSSGGGLFPSMDKKENTAELVLPIDKVLKSKENELLWEVTWK